MGKNDDLPDTTEAVSYDPETDTYRATFDHTTLTPSTAIVKALANVFDRAPTELAPLSEVIDPDALDQLMMAPASGQRRGDREVGFTYHAHSVTILSCGLVKIRPLLTDTSVEQE